MPPVIKLEKVILHAPLGLRFWDVVTQRTVGDGLVVTVAPASQPDRRTAAAPNRSGIYVFHRLPILGQLPIPDGSAPFWTAAAPEAGFVVEVEDDYGRFLPFRFPVTELRRGVFNLPCLAAVGSPMAGPGPGIPLFSAASRSIPAGMAAVRADLRQELAGSERGRKAAWALLSVSYNGKLLGRGMADENGSTVAVFPYPRPEISSSSSGLLGTLVPLHRQRWSLDLEVTFQPDDPLPDRPDLCHLLAAGPGTLLSQRAPALALGPVELLFGQETIVKTDDQSELFFSIP
jgi:hypothetical protein